MGVDQPGTRELVTLELNTDEGISGVGLTFLGGPPVNWLRQAGLRRNDGTGRLAAWGVPPRIHSGINREQVSPCWDVRR